MSPENNRHETRQPNLTWTMVHSGAAVAGATADALDAHGLALAIATVIAVGEVIVAWHRKRGE